MTKLLVNTPVGKQEVIQVCEGGGYFDPSRVLWDEREDGPLPQITLGGMVRDSGKLVFSQDRLAAEPPPDEPKKDKTDRLVDALIAKGVLTKDDLDQPK